MKHLVFLMVAIAACAALAKTSTPEGWTDDYDAALRWATAQKKLVLVDFSGSDWCGWCKELNNEVFDTDEFRAGAKDKYILLMIDTPRDQSLLSETAKKQNPELVEKYRVEDFPTVLLLDAQGEELFRTGYEKGGPVKYLKMLEEEVKFGPDIKKYIKPIEDVLNRHDDEMQKEMEAIKDKVEEAYPDVSTNQPLVRLRREQKRRERKMAEMAKRMMFEEVLAKYIPIYDKAFAEAKEMKVPAHMEVRKLELINGQERNFQAMKMAKAQYDLEAAKRKTKGAADEEDEKPPTDGRWHGLDWADVWAEGVRTNAALPTAWKYFTEQFRPYVRRELAMPTEGLFAKEMGELADAVADALWEPSSGSTLEFRLSVPYELAGKLVAAGCSNLTVRSLAAQGDFCAWVTNHTGCRPKALSARLQALGSELRGGSALALHLFAVVTVDKEGLAIADRALFAATKERPQDLRTVRSIIGCPAAAREPGADPWIALLADAEAERLAAWRGRGGGFANSVTEEGWRGFAEHLEKAKAKALKAHELHPEFPDAAVLLLDIAAPQCDRAETDRWFAEVLLREVDNSDAWGTYRFHMLLRWGGSIEDLRKLSDAVWNTQRFDTRLPFFAACTLRTIDDEQKLAGVRDPAKRVFADLEMRKRYVKGMEYVISDECAGCAANGAAREGLVEMFWTTGDWEEAARRKRELLDGCPRQFVRQGYVLNEQQELVLSAVGGPHSAALIALEKFCQCNLDGKQEVADTYRIKTLELLTPLSLKLDELTPAEQKVVKRRMAQIGSEKSEDGEWIEMSLEPGFPGWKGCYASSNLSTDWTFHKTCCETKNGDIAAINPLPANYEVEVSFETKNDITLRLDNKWLGDDENGVPRGHPSINVAMRWTKEDGTRPVFSAYGVGWNGKDYGDRLNWKLDKGKGSRHELCVAVNGQRISVWFDGKLVLDDSDHLKEHFSPRRKGCGFAVGGRALKLFKVRYRKIPEAGASARKMADKLSCRSEACKDKGRRLLT